MLTLLKNGLVIDGSGNEAYKADVLIDNDKIVKVASSIDDEGKNIIDCKGLTVAPGFIDAHSHNDFFYNYPNAEKFYSPFIKQGITTQITGNCGFSPFGIDDDSPYKDKVGGGLFHAKKPGSFKEFLIETKDNIYLNMAPLIGHGTTRISITGYNSNPLSKEQIDKQMKLVAEAMQNGALGGSFGFMYEPGMYSKKDEIYAFAKELAKYDGVLTVHPRACSKVAMGYPLISKPHIELALEEVIEIMKETGVQTEYSHLIFVGKSSWGSCDRMLKRFHDLRDEGYNIAYDNYSFTYGASVITVVLPSWYMALSKEKRKKPFNRFRLKLLTNIAKKALGIDFCDFKIAYISNDNKKYEGKTVSECAKEESLSDFDMYIKLVELSDGQGRLYLDKYYNDEIIRKLMLDDLSVFMTDAWVEEAGTQNGAAYQGFPYFLQRAKEYDIPVEKIIRKMTGATADRFGIKERGYIKEGMIADITVIDYDNIEVKPNVPDYTPKGVEYVFINGKKVITKGKYDAKKVGKIILKK